MNSSINEFNNLDNKIITILEANIFRRLLNTLQPTEKPSSTANTASYNRSSLVDKLRQAQESGTECENGSNGRFNSEAGSNYATFYNKTGNIGGTVEDIKPFLDGAGISKKFLRCYDLKKDKMGIAWLFDGSFEAKVLGWDKKLKKVIFQGKWKGGLFGGIKYAGYDEKTPEIEKKNYGYYILLKGKEIGPFSANQIITKINTKQPIYSKLDKLTNKRIGDPSKGIYDINLIIRPENSTDYQKISDNKLLSSMLAPIQTVTNPMTQKQKNLGQNIKLVSPKK